MHTPLPHIILLPVLKESNPGIIVYSVPNGSPASLSPQVIRGHYFLEAFSLVPDISFKKSGSLIILPTLCFNRSSPVILD